MVQRRMQSLDALKSMPIWSATQTEDGNGTVIASGRIAKYLAGRISAVPLDSRRVAWMAALNDRDRKRWVELAQQDRVAESSRFVTDLYWWDVARYILNQNHRDLVRIPDAFEWNTEFVMKATREQEKVVHLEFVRCFHNYVAAAKTMVDNTRALRKRWATEDFNRSFEDRLATIRRQDVICFVHDLRNAMHHSQLPRIHRVLTFEPVAMGSDTVGARTRLMVDAPSLLALHKLSASGRDYMRHAADGDSVDVALAVRRYHQVVGRFQEWFLEGVKTARQDLLEDFDARRLEMHRLTQH